MKRKINIASPIFGLLLVFSYTQAIGGLPGESIVLNPNTGDYTLTYWDFPDSPDAQIRQAIFVPATKIDPVVKSAFKLREKGEIVYSYRVTNGSKSKQPLIGMLFDPVTAIISSVPQPIPSQNLDINALKQIYVARKTALTSPKGWGGNNFERQTGKLRISWGFGQLDNLSDGLAPGKTQAGFGFSSNDLPGIGIAQLDGHSPVPMFPAEGPTGELAKEFEKIEQNDFVSRLAAVPTIAVPTPFNASVLLGRIQSHVHTWIASGLLDASFSSQLNRYFQAAIDAYSHNQPKVAKEHIETLRKMLKREHEGIDHDEDEKAEEKNEPKSARITIDRLAARVLDFDLKYVLKRSGGEKE